MTYAEAARSERTCGLACRASPCPSCPLRESDSPRLLGRPVWQKQAQGIVVAALRVLAAEFQGGLLTVARTSGACGEWTVSWISYPMHSGRAQERGDAFGLGRGLTFAHDPALVVDDADRRLFHRNVKADIILHGCPPQAAETRLGRISDPVQASLEGSRLPVTPLRTRSPITPSVLSRAFGAHFGLTPLAFRSRFSGDQLSRFRPEIRQSLSLQQSNPRRSSGARIWRCL